MSTSASPLYGTEDYIGLDNAPLDAASPLASSALIFPDAGTAFNPLDFLSGATSLFNPFVQQVDPTNSGDTGANQNTSSPALPSHNNPETAGGTNLGTVLNNAINAGFSAWQLQTLPKNTPRTVQTQVGNTRVVAGNQGVLSGIFGPTTQQGSQLLVIGVLIIVGILIYKFVKK